MFTLRPQLGLAHRRLTGAVAGTALVGCATLAVVAVPSPAAAAWPDGTVAITGHGYGHGRGMGQYGAYGYATLYGWTYNQILGHYYGGATLASRSLGSISVDLSALDGRSSVVVTSGSAFTAGAVKVAAGGAALLRYVGPNSYQMAYSPGCGKPWSAARTVTSGGFRSTVATSTLASMLTICNPDGSNRTYRGSLSVVYGGGQSRVVNVLAMDDYLRGVVPRESPAYWGDAAGGKGIAALQSQAVAARSYAAVQNRYSWARICDSQNCQVYGGAGRNGTIVEDQRTNTAVLSTSGKVLTNSSGSMISAEYSSSTGGWTAGGTFPAVPDLGDTVSPNHNWSTSISASTIGNAFGVGTLQAVSTTGNGLGADGGRVLSVTVKGSSRTVTVTGAQFRGTFGLLSDWFRVAAPLPEPPPPPKPSTPPTFYLTNSLTNPAVNIARTFGLPGDRPLACDFNGDGTDTAGVYRAPNFYYRDSFTAAAPLHTVRLGVPGDRPVCGDWNGDGTDTVGVYRPSNAMFYLLNTNNRLTTSPLTQVLLGGSGAIALAGDWNGDRAATPGVYDPKTSTFYLVNTLRPGSPRLRYTFGLPGNFPVSGDWDGNGSDSYGVFQGTRFELANTLGGGSSVNTRFGQPGDRPVAGDFNHDHKDSVGVGRGY